MDEFSQDQASTSGWGDVTDELSSSTPIASVEEAVVYFEESVELLDSIADELLQQSAVRFLALANQLQSLAGDDEESALEPTALVISGANAIRDALADPDAADAAIELGELVESCQIADSEESDVGDLAWCDDSSDESEENIDDIATPSAEEIGILLSQIRNDSFDESSDHETAIEQQETFVEAHVAAVKSAAEDAEEPIDDFESVSPELREAFLDDAGSCLAAMEQALLRLETDSSDEDARTVLARELHTMKGASASIGLAALASYIHSVEEILGKATSDGEALPIEELLGCVDSIKARANGFTSKPETVAAKTPTDGETCATLGATDLSDHADDNESVRVNASRLNRLMDMLCELVLLRNERDSELAKLITVNESLVQNVSRLRMLGHHQHGSSRQRQSGQEFDLDDGTQVSDIANDVFECAQQLRKCYQPVSDGNTAVSDFIRKFQSELAELRRAPISGLFNRLRRAISDAARAEGKKVQVQFDGDQTGIDRSLQSSVFEPLLHIVRNSVSHGIETPEERTGAGKTIAGTIHLKAFAGPEILVVEIQDDGQGLDYEAIKRRGIQRGLIEPGASPSEQELAQLIFHPGFSTRETVTEVSGRGVGMDVVSSTLQRLRGWVEVNSCRGLGTTIRLSLPLQSMIQHSMLFRSCGQLFALPITSVQQADSSDATNTSVSIDLLLDLGRRSCVSDPEVLVVDLATKSESDAKGNRHHQTVSLLVDELVGPEEVVVRPLPNLLKHHPICSGATLSSVGEPALLLDAKRLIERAEMWHDDQGAAVDSDRHRETIQRVLVVDDSVTVRLRVVQSLRRYEIQIVQANDGQEAWDLIQEALDRDQAFATVFSDIDMPRMNGLELLARIKQHETNNQMPVILISGRTDEVIRQQATQMGALACLQKPLTDLTLDSIVQQLPLAFPSFH